MHVQQPRLRNKLMLAAAFITGMLAVPGAFAHDYRGYSGYRSNHDNSSQGWHGHDRGGNAIGALIVGAVVGGLIVNALDHPQRTYYSQPTYYAPPPPPSSYYNDGSYGNPPYAGDGYSGGSYYDNGYAPAYTPSNSGSSYYGDDGY